MSALIRRGQHGRAERFERYRELRDAGTRPVDAGREVGVSDSTGGRYERTYRDLRGLPRKRPGAWR